MGTGADGDRAAEDAVILAGSIGRGHLAVAEACRSAFTALGLRCAVVDCMRELGGLSSAVGERIYRLMLARPAVYDAFHFSQLRTGGRLAMASDAAARRRLLPPVRALLDRLPGTAPPLLVSVFATGAAVAAALKAERPGITTLVLCTDATAHRMWVHEGTDLFLATSQLAAATVRRYRPTAAVSTVVPPVRPPFYEAPPRDVARAALGLPPAGRQVMLMSGGWGIGPIAESAAALARAGHGVLAVAGTNRRAEQALRAAAVALPGIRPYGFTERIPELMAAADLVVTAPGQSCHEARAVGRPMVVLDAVPGHGRENLLHELSLGGAQACSPDAGSVAAAVDAALADPEPPPPWPIRSAAAWCTHLETVLRDAGFRLPARSDPDVAR